MADPFRGGLIAEIRRDELHSQDIAGTIEDLRDSLGREGIPFGIIGAIAMRHHGYWRFTEDLDILTSREGLAKIHAKLVGRGLVPRAAGLRKKLRHTGFKVNIDIVTEGEHAGSKESPIVFPAPDSQAFIEVEGLRIATLETLIALKITSGVWAHRDQDFADVQKLIRSNQLSDAFAAQLPAVLRDKYLELLARSRLERELEE
jgi:hypothetical protein